MLKLLKSIFARKRIIDLNDEEKMLVDGLETKIRKSIGTCEANGRDKTIVNVTYAELQVLKSIFNQINN